MWCVREGGRVGEMCVREGEWVGVVSEGGRVGVVWCLREGGWVWCGV